jgi:hypothetical protein
MGKVGFLCMVSYPSGIKLIGDVTVLVFGQMS